ncbi:MAG: ribonuclease E activity regulator RraA [Ardenticatenaceae bacterium]
MNFKTADLCDEFTSIVQMGEPIFRDYGGIKTFGGPIATVKVFEDNVLVRRMLETPGEGRVLVVDGGGSKRCALLGDRLAGLGDQNGWAGVVIYGCLRDSVDVANIALGVKALASVPKRSNKKGEGDTEITLHFAGVTFTPGHYLYADPDGILVAPKDLLQE